MKISLRGKYNDLELGTVEDGIYTPTGLLADRDHTWKILNWVDTELKNGDLVRVIKTEESK